MIGARKEIRGTLVTLTPLRIATGERELVAANERSQGANYDGTFTISRVSRTANELPYIPGSSLKGVIRRLVPDAHGLLGVVKKGTDGAESQVVSGTAIFWDACLSAQQADKVWTAAQRRTEIDDATGAAAAGYLFAEEFVKPGARFDLEIYLADDCAEADEYSLRSALAQLMSADGVAMGADSRQGMGRVQLIKDSLQRRHLPPGKAGEWLKWEIEPCDQVLSGKQFHLTLACNDAFLIAEGSGDSQNYSCDGKRNNVITSLRNEDGLGPQLTGSTLIGSLRAAFEWHFASSKPSVYAPGCEMLPESVTDRLFGTPDWRGRVVIDKLKLVGKPRRLVVPSVKIDRFSGAPIDNALFFTEAWTDVEFCLRLRLDRRGRPENGNVFDADDAVFEDFLTFLADDMWGGLQLGHGDNSGYGWFRVTIANKDGEQT